MGKENRESVALNTRKTEYRWREGGKIMHRRTNQVRLSFLSTVTSDRRTSTCKVRTFTALPITYLHRICFEDMDWPKEIMAILRHFVS